MKFINNNIELFNRIPSQLELSKIDSNIRIIIYDDNQEYYIGYTSSSGIRNGLGFYKWKSGSKYIGNWNNIRDGYGKYWVNDNNNNDRSFQKGFWIKNKMNGYGECYFSDGD